MHVSTGDCPMCGGKMTLRPHEDLIALPSVNVKNGNDDKLMCAARSCVECNYMDLHTMSTPRFL